MPTVNDAIGRFLDREGFILAREHPRWTSTLGRRCRAGQLVRLHPGVFADPSGITTELRLRALCRWAPAAVLHGETAARLWFGELPVNPIQLAHPYQISVPGWVNLMERRIPADQTLRRADLTLVTPAYCAAEQAGSDDGAVAMRMFREGLADPSGVAEAARTLSGSVNQAARNRVVRELARDPWSPAERLLHHLLNQASISGWEANRKLWLPSGLVVPDVLFEEQRLVIEVDGYAHHGAAEAFQKDRERQNLLVAAGYTVLRFTWHDLTRRPEWVIRIIRASLRAQNRRSD